MTAAIPSAAIVPVVTLARPVTPPGRTTRRSVNQKFPVRVGVGTGDRGKVTPGEVRLLARSRYRVASASGLPILDSGDARGARRLGAWARSRSGKRLRQSTRTSAA